MRRFLICGGFHGRDKSLEWVKRAADLRRPDGILCPGGILNTPRHFAAKTTPFGLSKEDGQFLERFFDFLGKLNIFTAIIPGSGDTPLEEFLRIGMHAEIQNSGLHIVHATLVEKGDVAISGLGGMLLDNGTNEIDSISHTMAEYYLRSFRDSEQPRKILLLPDPPLGKLSGEDGREITGNFIDSFHPNLCVVGGYSDYRGFVRVAHTYVVNPGWISEGWAAWLDWSLPYEDQLELLDLRDARKLVGIETGVGD